MGVVSTESEMMMAGIAVPWRHGWQRSTHCDSGACVEVARMQPMVAVRDGKEPEGPVLIFASREWQAFVAAVRDHEL